MKIAFFEIQGWEIPYIRKSLKGHKIIFKKETLSLNNASQIKDCDAVSVFIYSIIDRKILQKLPKVKLIATRSTGFEHIDLDDCKRKKISVCNVPFYGENTVAEHTFALILSLSRNIHKAYLKTLRQDFSIEGLRGFDLKGKTLGVVGAGHIGLHVIRIAKGFGMDVVAYDSHQNNFLAEVLGFKYVSFEELLKKADILTFHVPLTKETRHLINKKNISLIKKGALLINTSRGGVIETEALIKALDKKILNGIGLDVLEGEELIKEEKQLLYDQKKVKVLSELVKDHILLSKENVVFSPHIAFYSKEALERILETTVQNILAFKEGKGQNSVV